MTGYSPCTVIKVYQKLEFFCRALWVYLYSACKLCSCNLAAWLPFMGIVKCTCMCELHTLSYYECWERCIFVALKGLLVSVTLTQSSLACLRNISCTAILSIRWSTHWFKCDMTIPREWAGCQVRFRWDSNCEAMVSVSHCLLHQQIIKTLRFIPLRAPPPPL